MGGEPEAEESNVNQKAEGAQGSSSEEGAFEGDQQHNGSRSQGNISDRGSWTQEDPE